MNRHQPNFSMPDPLPDPFSRRVKRIIRRIPRGRVTTYGMIAADAGNPRAARQVGWILHASARKHGLPWHRVVNRNGRVSVRRGDGDDIQKQLLEKEGVVFDENGVIDLAVFAWFPSGLT